MTLQEGGNQVPALGINQEGGTLVTIKQQQAFKVLKDGRFQTVVTEPTVKTVSSLDEAIKTVYVTFAEAEKVESHYAVISINGRFHKTIKIGSDLDGFRAATG